ncbi:broad substrate specificity ATP-binding cassette transporter ABCG2-like [Symsagittifera roscoffensis]
MNVEDMKPWISWLQWISITRHSLGPMTASQTENLEFCGTRTFELNNNTYKSQYTCENGVDILKQQGIGHDAEDLWLSVVILFIIIVVTFSATFTKIIFTKKQK